MSARPKPLAALDQAILELIERARAELVDFVCATVRVPSVTGGEGAIAPLLSDWFTGNGFESVTETIGYGFRDRLPGLGHETHLEERPNVYGWWRSARSQCGPLVLNGHTDVIPAGDESAWRHPPFGAVVEGGRIHGRGATDMKGPLVAGMFAIRALRDAGAALPFDVQLQCVMGEETGGLGTLAAIASGPDPSVALVLEPTECTICPASAGVLQFTISVEGRAVHTSVPWYGVSALDKLICVYDALRSLAERRSRELSHPLFDGLPAKAPFAVGTFVAGEFWAAVPHHASMSGRIGVLPGESLDDVRALVAATVAGLADDDAWFAEHPPRLVWANAGFPGWETPLDAPIVRALRDGARAAGGRSPLGAATYGSDAGHFAAAGIPTILFGPGRIADAHLNDESIAIDDLLLAAKVLALGIARYADRINETIARPAG